jgi:hypothetical protein
MDLIYISRFADGTPDILRATYVGEFVVDGIQVTRYQNGEEYIEISTSELKVGRGIWTGFHVYEEPMDFLE